MAPPTNIDGSQVQEITIDGTPVQEVTVDGQTVFKSFTPPVAVSNLIFWMPFDPNSYSSMTDNADDASNGLKNSPSSNSHDGTVNGATYLPNGGQTDINAGTNSGAFQFDRSNNEDIKVNNFTFTVPRTYCGWVKLTSSVSKAGVFRIFSGFSANTGFIVDHPADEYIFGVSNGQLRANNVPLNEYLHFGMAVDSSESVTGHINGQKVGTLAKSNSFSFTNETISIGSHDADPNRTRFFEGNIDDFRIYNRELTTSEINQIYNNTKV
jgi:hypothetical protein